MKILIDKYLNIEPVLEIYEQKSLSKILLFIIYSQTCLEGHLYITNHCL